MAFWLPPHLRSNEILVWRLPPPLRWYSRSSSENCFYLDSSLRVKEIVPTFYRYSLASCSKNGNESVLLTGTPKTLNAKGMAAKVQKRIGKLKQNVSERFKTKKK